MGFVWGLTVVSFIQFLTGFSAKPAEDKFASEQYDRLVSVFSKNKFGFHTKFMSNFDLFLEAALNERFLEESTKYQDDFTTGQEIEDTEAGLAGELAPADIRHLNRDPDNGHAEQFKALMKPDRVGTNYVKSDALSCYKIHPKGQKPLV